MKLLDFVREHNAKKIYWDTNPGGQCTDLVEQYNHDVLNLPQLGGNAIDFWTVNHGGHYEKIANTPINYPVAGDIIVWEENAQLGIPIYGHTAVVLAANADTLLTFDQNWPDGSAPALINHYDYTGVAGWLHPHNSVVI